jgi:lipooligosaccharide transport system ATP-binding protein
MALLEASGLVKSFGGARVVDGVDLACDQGQVLGVLGPNGAGKTTTLKMLYGFLEPEGGSIRIGGADFAAARSALKRRIGVCAQDDTLDEEFDVAGNLRQCARYFRPRVDDIERRIDALIATFGLEEHRAKRPPQLSGGLRRRLSIARAVVHGPQVLFLDEPTTGLDPQARVSVWELVARLRREGLAIVLTTHYMDEAARLIDAVLVLKDGKVLARGTPRELLGRLLGEHVVVLTPPAEFRAELAAWLTAHSEHPPATVLDEWRVPMGAATLAAFCQRFPTLKMQVRDPDLDDLFLTMSREGA